MQEQDTQKPAKIWAPATGYMIPSLKKAIAAEPEKFERVMEVEQADIVYLDEELDRNEDYDTKYNTLANVMRRAVDGGNAKVVPWMPYMMKASAKKSTAVMSAYGKKMFPGTFELEPKNFKIPEYMGELKQYMKENPEKFFIAKPSMEDVGVGITMIKSVEELDDETLVVPNREYVIQEYINNPQTIGDAARKIDWRVSMCEIFRDGKSHVFFNTKSQGRAAPVPYKPLTKDDDNKDRSSHLTFCMDIFFNGKYTPSEDLSIVNDTYNFMTFDTIAKWYEENGIPGWAEKAQNLFEDFLLQHTALHHACFRFCYEFMGRGLQEKFGFDYFTFWGNDILFDEDFKPNWVESNLAPSNGDKAEEDDNCGYAPNKAFQIWGQECLNLWLEAGRDPKGYLYKDNIDNYKKIQGNEGQEYPYEKERDCLSKLFDLFIWLVTGTTVLPPCVPGEHYDRFPTKMTVEQAYKLHDLVPRVSKEQIKEKFFSLEASSDLKDCDYFLLCQIIVDLYSREEILDIYEKIFK